MTLLGAACVRRAHDRGPMRRAWWPLGLSLAGCRDGDSNPPGTPTVAAVIADGLLDDVVYLDVWGDPSAPFIGVQDPCSELSDRSFVFDTSTGAVVWTVTYPEAETSPNGLARFTEAPLGLLAGFGGRVYVALDYDGVVVDRYDFGSELLHHEIRQEADGGFSALFHEQVGETLLDGVLTWRDGAVVDRWFWGDHASWEPVSGQWSHANSFDRAPDGSLLVSFFALDTVVAVAPDGEPRWALSGGPPNPLLNPQLDVESLVAPPGFFNQHSARWADGGVVFLDNGHARALRVAVDETAGTATIERAYKAIAFDTTMCTTPYGTVEPVGADGVLVGCRDGAQILEYGLDDGALRWSARAVCPRAHVGTQAYKWQPLYDPGWAGG